MYDYDTGDGWIKLHRKILRSAIYCDSDYLKLWITLLLMANHETTELLLDGRKIRIQPGQFVSSRRKMSVSTGIDQHKIDRILKYLKSEQQIEQVNLSSCRLISIINWEVYQSREPQNEQRVSHGRATGEPRVSTNKNEKNIRTKEYQHSTSTLQFDSPSANESKHKASQVEINEYCASLQLPVSDAEYLFNHWEGCGWRNGRHAIRDWKATIRAWKAAGHLPSQKNGNGHHPKFETRLERTMRIAKEIDERLTKEEAQ